MNGGFPFWMASYAENFYWHDIIIPAALIRNSITFQVLLIEIICTHLVLAEGRRPR